MDASILCCVCGTETVFVFGEELCHFHASHTESFCAPCLTQYISNKISEGNLGASVQIFCPCSHVNITTIKRVPLNFRSWSILIDKQMLEKYKSYSSSILSFLCSGCHTLKSLMITEPNSNHIENLIKDINPLVLQSIEDHEKGKLSLDDFFGSLSQFFPALSSGQDDEAWNALLQILQILVDPHLRANLHLRYLKMRPRLETRCCKRYEINQNK